MQNTNKDYVIEIDQKVPQEVLSFCRERSYQHQQEVLPHLKGKTFLDDHMYLPESLIETINNWCESIGLPELDYAVLFQKHDLPNTKNNSIHIDYNADYNDVAKSALNIPIANFENTEMTYWSGNYEKKILYANSTCCKDDQPSGDIKIPYLDLKWHGEPILEYTYKVSETPHLCRIDVPHGVTASENFRVVLSIRFNGNPTFSEVSEMYTNKEAAYDI